MIVETENQRCPDIGWVCPACLDLVPESLIFVVAMHMKYCRKLTDVF